MRHVKNSISLITAALLFCLFCHTAIASEDSAYRKSATEHSAITANHFFQNETFAGKENLLLWNEYGGSVSYSFKLESEGEYYIGISYAALQSKSDFIELDIDVSSKQTVNSLILNRPIDIDAMSADGFGNSLRATQSQSTGFNYELLREKTGFLNEPCILKLQEGEITVTLHGVRTDFYIEYIQLVSKQELKTAEESFNSAKDKTLADTHIKIQAENASKVSHSMLGAQFDRSDALVQPMDTTHLLLNIAGGSNWNADGQWMQWSFTAPQSGWYELRFKYRQGFKSGLSVNRRIYIDGKTPCIEADAVGFAFNDAWQINTVQNADGAPALIYLNKGEHSLRMEVVPGAQATLIQQMQKTVSLLSEIYRRIIMVTGTSPDINRDYYLDRDVPNLIEQIKSALIGINSERMALEEISKSSGSLTAITNLQVQLQSFIAMPSTIPKRLDTFKGNIDSLSIWLNSVSEQPLDLDYITFAPPKSTPERANSNAFEGIVFSVKTLVGSFMYDSEINSASESEVLNVWVGMGRDQLQTVKQLVDSDFTTKTGYKVKVSQVQQGVTEAILGGTGPDVMLFADNSEIVNLAMRGALAPLSSLSGFEPLQEACQVNAYIPYSYKGECYGLPLTQLYQMMFYRTDIFTELGLTPPKTWEELYKIIPVLQRKNMQVGVPSHDQTFASMLLQNGGSYYNSKLTATALSNNTAVDVFRKFTRLYTDYGLLVSYDFYNRFRSGEMPLALADYNQHSFLKVAAPEIAGKWEMLPIPGTKNEKGDISNSALATSGSGCFMLSSSTMQKEGWEFMKWFASANIQAEYGLSIEASVGAAGRYTPVNMLAFDKLGWLSSEGALLKEQWSVVNEMPNIPGSYYTKRNLASAFRKVVYNGANPRETLLKYTQEIDSELQRKLIEYG